GLRVCDEQTECPWPTCQKAPSVALTRGWERHDLLADLGNNAAENTKLNKNIPVPKSDEKPVKAKQEEKTTVEAE
ncbi:hypothetical protein ACET8S_17645, partial [Aeromonas veronii]